ncbi:MAG: YraN family protein [bacterium]|nr:YraN family protein [bacterium]
MARHNLLGEKGEEAARVYLKRNGYKIIEQNRRTKRGEVDIIARYKEWLVFVEVRAKSGQELGTPEETIDWRKKRKLERNAQAYVFYTKYKGLFRIDAVCVVFDELGGVSRLTHYENIVENPQR